MKNSLTKEQTDYRKTILKGKISSVKNAEAVKIIYSDDDRIKECFYYFNNCVFWINEYIDGRTDKARLLKTAQSIKNNAEKLESILK